MATCTTVTCPGCGRRIRVYADQAAGPVWLDDPDVRRHALCLDDDAVA